MNDSDPHSSVDRLAAHTARDWIVRLSSGSVSDADMRRFKAWRDAHPDNRQAFERERAYWQGLRGLQGSRQPASRRIGSGSTRRRLLVGGGMAAALAVGAGTLVAMRARVDFSTSFGELARFTLPDGSAVALNTDSAIAVDYRPGFRQVSLVRGEALFRVGADPGTVFRVVTHAGLCETSGAEFCIRQTDDTAMVSLLTGFLRLSAAGHGGIDVGPGMQAGFGHDGLILPVQADDTDRALAWLDRRIVFDGVPFSQALAELSRYVPERILAPGISDERVSGVFSTNDVPAAVRVLARTQGLRVGHIPRLLYVVV